MQTRRNAKKQHNHKPRINLILTPPKPAPPPPPPVPVQTGPRKRGRPRKNPLPVVVDPNASEPAAPIIEVVEEPKEPFTMALEESFEYQHPPTEDLIIPEIQPLNNEPILNEFPYVYANFLITQWWNGHNAIISDETDYFKLQIVSIFIAMLKKLKDDVPPILIITNSLSLSRWLIELRQWIELRVFVFGSSKSERKVIGDNEKFFNPASPKNFDIIIISREQFVRDASSLPKVKWGTIIVDDLTQKKATFNSSIANIHQISRFQTILLFKNYSLLQSHDLKTANQVVNLENSSDIMKELTIDDAIAFKAIDISVHYCPLTVPQIKAIQQVYISNRDQLARARNEVRHAQFLCQCSKEVRNIASHPSLSESQRQIGNEDPAKASGKIKELMKLITPLKEENRRILVVCSSLKTVNLIHIALISRNIQHWKFDVSTRVKQQHKIVISFNASEGLSLFILSVQYLKDTLPVMNPDSIIAFDIEWAPMQNTREVIQWYHRASRYPAKIFQLISLNSMEQLMFELLWNEPDKTPAILEDPESTDIVILLNFLKLAAQLVFDLDQPTVSSYQVLTCSKHEPFPKRKLDDREDFWDILLPKTGRTKQQRQLSPNQYWVPAQIDYFVEMLCDFGWNRWELFEQRFGRQRSEIMRVGAVILKRMLSKIEGRELMVDLLSEYNANDIAKMEMSLGESIDYIDKFDANQVLDDIEFLIPLYKIKPKNVKTIPIDEDSLEPLGEGWTIDDDKQLLFHIFTSGLHKIPSDFHPELADQFRSRASKLFPVTAQKRKNTIITLRPPKKFTLAEHRKVVNTLMTYGFTTIEDFKDHADLLRHQNEALQRYIDNIYRYCASASEERKALLPLLAEKMAKYTTQKIPTRRELFEKIRIAATSYNEYAAEDLEFLAAIAAHGFENTSNSPILMVSCLGDCSEPKLFGRIKALFSERHRNRVSQRIQMDIKKRLPLRINDMLMLLDLGNIKGYHTRDYIYPIGYKCAVVCLSSDKAKEILTWVECTITEKNGEPLFSIAPYNEENGFYFEGKDPDVPFQQLRNRLMKKFRKYIPPYCGHEMFGLTSAFVNRLFIEMQGIEKCTNYCRRFFKSTFMLIPKWPIIGQYEPNYKNLAPQLHTTTKFHYSRKAFGDLLPPLVLNFSPLFSCDEKMIVVDVRQMESHFPDLINRYLQWGDPEMERILNEPIQSPPEVTEEENALQNEQKD